MRMRISTTTLESFRLWSDPEQEWMSEQDLIDTILGKFTPNEKILVGQAFDGILERPLDYKVDGGYASGGYFFSDEDTDQGIALMDYQRGTFQAKATKDYGALCTVVSKADQIVGAHLFEHKTTLGTFDFDKYANSFQWRFMADMFEPSVVTYHVFLLKDPDDQRTVERPDGTDAVVKVIQLKDIESFNLYPYAEMHGDCCELLMRFVSFVRARNLDGFLRQRAAEARSVWAV